MSVIICHRRAIDRRWLSAEPLVFELWPWPGVSFAHYRAHLPAQAVKASPDSTRDV